VLKNKHLSLSYLNSWLTIGGCGPVQRFVNVSKGCFSVDTSSPYTFLVLIRTEIRTKFSQNKDLIRTTNKDQGSIFTTSIAHLKNQ
jgi:hypothetical protein